MKSRFFSQRLLLAAASALCLLGSHQSHAAARWWDGTSTTGDADGGDGTWSQTGAGWRTTATGGSATAYSSGTTAQQAAFAGTAGTVTVSGTVYISGASVTAGSAALNANANYAFGGTGTIQLGGGSFIHTPATVTFGSGLTINKNGQSLVFSNGGDVDALITGSGDFAKGGGGTLFLNHAANSFSSNITHNQGMIVATTLKANGANSSLGTGSIILLGAAVADSTTTLRYDGTGGADGSTNRTIQLSGNFSYTAALSQNGTGHLTYSGGISSTTNFAKTLELSGSSAGTGEISGNITNGTNVVSLTKSGIGQWTLSGASNSYTGATNVNGGTLVVASGIGNSAVTVSNAGSILATDAAASFGSTVAINNGAILAAGGAASAGTATVSGATTFNNGSVFSWDISANGASYDKLIAPSLAGEVTPGDAVFRIVVADNTFADAFWDNTQTWTTIFTTNGTTAIANWANLFTVNVVNSAFGTLDTSSYGTFSISGSTLTWTAVPEPSTALGGLLLTAGLFRRRRHAKA